MKEIFPFESTPNFTSRRNNLEIGNYELTNSGAEAHGVDLRLLEHPKPELRLIECANDNLEQVKDNEHASENLGLYNFVDQLQHLNSEARVACEWDGVDSYIMSSVDAESLKLPLGYNYDADKGLSNELFADGTDFDNFKVKVNKTSIVDCFVSNVPEKAREFHSKILDSSLGREINSIEKPKTDEQSEQIDRIINITNNDRIASGLEKRFIDSRLVRFYDSAAWHNQFTDDGYFDQVRQTIDLVEPMSKIHMLDSVAHELIHASSYNKVIEENGIIKHGQLGFMSIKDGKKYFCAINEAVTQERTRQIVSDELANNPYYVDEVTETVGIKEKYPRKRYSKNDKIKRGQEIFSEDGALGAMIVEDGKRESIVAFGDKYRLERRTLNKLVNKLSKYSKEPSYKVYEMFVEVTKSGDYTPVARLVDTTFGKDTFKRLGENSTTGEDFKSFVDKLEIMRKMNNVKKLAKTVIGKFFKSNQTGDVSVGF